MLRQALPAVALLLLGALSVAAEPITSPKWGQTCNANNTHLDSNTWALDTDCDAVTYCADNSTCAYRGCRTDLYPYGYNGVAYDQLPPLCPAGQVCPDEGSKCVDLIAVGGQCQKDRDDECQPPPNMNDLAGYLNVNGSVCLNFNCYYANVTAGGTCVLENTVYNAYGNDGDLYSYIISRDNCANGFWCDATSTICNKGKNLGASCTGNKECISYNCRADQKCGPAADEPIHPASWVYAVIGVSIAILIVGIMVSLWLAHRRSRNENQIKLEQYYNEQLAYRQSILSMSQARNSLLIGGGGGAKVTPGSGLSGKPLSPGGPSGYDLDLPPNMRRDSSQFGFSDHEDSEELLSGDAVEPNQAPRWRRP